eukprot:1130698-Rhodomonas_salina.5
MQLDRLRDRWYRHGSHAHVRRFDAVAADCKVECQPANAQPQTESAHKHCMSVLIAKQTQTHQAD